MEKPWVVVSLHPSQVPLPYLSFINRTISNHSNSQTEILSCKLNLLLLRMKTRFSQCSRYSRVRATSSYRSQASLDENARWMTTMASTTSTPVRVTHHSKPLQAKSSSRWLLSPFVNNLSSTILRISKLQSTILLQVAQPCSKQGSLPSRRYEMLQPLRGQEPSLLQHKTRIRCQTWCRCKSLRPLLASTNNEMRLRLWKIWWNYQKTTN